MMRSRLRRQLSSSKPAQKARTLSAFRCYMTLSTLDPIHTTHYFQSAEANIAPKYIGKHEKHTQLDELDQVTAARPKTCGPQVRIPYISIYVYSLYVLIVTQALNRHAGWGWKLRAPCRLTLPAMLALRLSLRRFCFEPCLLPCTMPSIP